jgi:hypothetical protein
VFVFGTMNRKCKRGVSLKRRTGSKGEGPRDEKPQERNGSGLRAIPVVRMRLFEGKKAL